MKLEIERDRMLIVPETPQDEALLEEVYGLSKDGDSVLVVRHNATNMDCWAYAEISSSKRSKT